MTHAVATFRATTRSEADVGATRDQMWAVLTDPATIARLTPLLTRIDADGDQWVWHMVEVKGAGVGITPTFTETMTFTPKTRIEYAHTGRGERVGVDGWYEISDGSADDRVHLAIELTVSVDLPLPKVSSPAVTRVMKQTMQRMGDRFAKNLCSDLGYC